MDGGATHVEQVERRGLDGRENAQIVRTLEAAALLDGQAVGARDVGRVEEPVGAGLHARARVGGQSLGDRPQRRVHRLGLRARDRQRLLATAAQQIRQHHHRREDRPDDRRVGADARANPGERVQLFAERARPWIDGREPRGVGRAGQRGLRHAVLDRPIGGRPVRQSPHFGKALRARLRLEEVPVEDARQTQRLVRQSLGGVLGHEVVQPEAERHAVDGIATQGGQDALALGRHHLIAYGLMGVPTARVTGKGGATRRNA